MVLPRGWAYETPLPPNLRPLSVEASQTELVRPLVGAVQWLLVWGCVEQGQSTKGPTSTWASPSASTATAPIPRLCPRGRGRSARKQAQPLWWGPDQGSTPRRGGGGV